MHDAVNNERRKEALSLRAKILKAEEERLSGAHTMTVLQARQKLAERASREDGRRTGAEN